MKAAISYLVLGTTLISLAGCTTRSISDSSYRRDSYHGRTLRDPSTYKGELNELDVLGIERTTTVSEEDIVRALDTASRIRLHKGGSIMLVQSGARWPDEPMSTELAKSFNVVSFSGMPNEFEREAYHRALRMAAARGGCEAIVCYWGVLESARQNLDSKAISWVPIVGSVIPDESQHMRIRLKVAVIDVRTGNWAMFSPDPFEHESLSMRARRERSDQTQVFKLKQQAYAAAARDLVKAFAN